MSDPNDEREFDADSGFERTVGNDTADDTTGPTADDAATTADDTTPSTDHGTSDASTVRMRAALAEIRREGRKVAFLYALLDGGLVALAVNVGLRLFRPGPVDGSFRLPDAVAGAGGILPNTVHFAAVAGLVLGVLAFTAEYVVRTRRPLVEQFEAANPNVREALRTARDSAEDGSNTEMARRLYEDVLDGLRRTSSHELVATRRVVVTALLVVVVSLASIHVAVVDLNLTETFGGDDAPDASDRPDDRETPDDEELQDGEQILGDSENVSAGDDSIDASVQGTGSGEGEDGSTGPASSYDDGGFADAAVQSQQAGYDESENVEDADLIREYNLQIREQDDEDEDTT